MKYLPGMTPPEGSWKRLLGASALAFILSSGLVGCSGDVDDPEEIPTPTPTPEQPTDPDDGNAEDPWEGSFEEGEDNFLGTAPGDEGDYAYLELEAQIFEQITPENAGKWESVEAERDVMDWTALDKAYNFAQDNDLAFKFHVLVWGLQQPSWLGDLTPEEQLAEVDEWMAAVAERYPDLTMIEVVNEPLHETPVYAEALGGAGETGWDWIITSFEMAREHFPDAQLMINDYNILWRAEATADYLGVIEPLMERDLLDGFGVQAHFLERMDVATVKANLDTLAETDLPIYVSEFDLDLADDVRHANQFKDLFTMFWEHPAVAGVTLWGHREGSVWQEGGYLLNADGTEREAMVWLQCYLDGGTNCTVPEYVPTGWQGDEYGVTLEAELFDETEGVLASGSTIAYADDGEWIAFYAVEFQATWDTFWLTYAKGNEDAARVTVHLDSLDNDPIYDIDLEPTGSWGTSETIELAFAPRTSTHDVFLQFHEGATGVGNIDSIRFGQPLPTSTVNILPNGGFEAGLTGWSSWYGATLEVATDKAHSGDQSLLITDRNYGSTDQPGRDNAGYTLTDLVSPGTTYTVSAWVQHTGAVADTIRLGGIVECSDPPAGHNSYPWIVNQTDIPPNTWTQISGPLIIPDCDVTNVVVNVEGTSEGVDVYVDDVIVSPPGENLISNGGFEAGISGWTNGGWTSSLFEHSSDEAHSGTYSLNVYARDSVDDNAVYSLAGLVEGNTTYTVRAWIKVEDTSATETPAKVTAKVQCTGETAEYPAVVEYTAADPIATGEWVELVGSFTTPDCEVSDSLLIIESVEATSDFYLDDVSVMAQ